MTTLLIAGIVSILGMLLLRWHIRKRAHDAARALALVERMRRNSELLANDDHIPDGIAETVLGMVMAAGTGRLTRIMLLYVVGARGFSGKVHDSEYDRLSDQQNGMIVHLIVDSLIFDTLHFPIAGALVRRVFFWLLVAEASPKAKVSTDQVEPILQTYRQSVPELCAA